MGGGCRWLGFSVIGHLICEVNDRLEPNLVQGLRSHTVREPQQIQIIQSQDLEKFYSLAWF